MCQIYAIDIINLEYVRIVILFLFYKLEEQQSPLPWQEVKTHNAEQVSLLYNHNYSKVDLN